MPTRTFAAVAVLLAGAIGSARAAASACPVEGELVQWIADYCMSKLETDDEIAASDCIAKELQGKRGSACAAKQHFKRTLCELAVARAHVSSVEQCVADRSFAGSTVRQGGVGGQRSPASAPRR
jgi:hypothetical protein